MMYIPGDFGRPPPSQLMNKNVASTFLNSSMYPVTTLDSNSIFKINQNEFQFEGPEGTYIPEFALKLPRTPLLLTDPSTYISVSPFTENNIRKYHSAIGNLNHDNIKNPLSLDEIRSLTKQDQLPLGSGVNPLSSDYFKPVHLTPGCLLEVVSFDSDSSPTLSSSSFNLMGRSNTLKGSRNTSGKMKLWGTGRKGSVSAPSADDRASTALPTPVSELRLPKTSLSRSSSTFITKASTTDSLSKKLSTVSELMVALHGRFLNVINLHEDYTRIEIDIPYVRILFSVGVITCLATFASPRGQDRSLDIVVGFSSGDLVWLNPFKMKYTRFNKNAKLISKPVTSVTWSPCGRLVYAGFSNGEIMLFSREFDDDEAYDMNLKVRRTQFAKYFRLLEDNTESNPVAHFQLSNKPITLLKFNPVAENLCCIASDDGFLKLLDLSTMFISDISPSYYGGLLCLQFTRDGRYLLTGGEDDFVAVYELHASVSGNLRLVARLEGPESWIRSIQIDYPKSEANLLVYRISAVGDDGKVAFWEFQPRNLPKTKRPLHHRNKSSNLPRVVSTLSTGGQHRRKISSLAAGNSALRLKESSSMGSTNSLNGAAHQHLSIAQTINSSSQVSLGRLGSGVELKGRRSLSKEAKWTPLNSQTIVHAPVGISAVPVLPPLLMHDIRLGRLSGISFAKKHIWTVTCGGDAVRWSRN